MHMREALEDCGCTSLTHPVRMISHVCVEGGWTSACWSRVVWALYPFHRLASCADATSSAMVSHKAGGAKIST